MSYSVLEKKRRREQLERERMMRIRKRVIQVVLAVIIVIGMFSLVQFNSNAKSDKEYVKLYTNVEVQYGESIWTIAEKYADEEHYTMDSYIKEVQYMNHLENADDIRAGDYLVLPYYRVQS